MHRYSNSPCNSLILCVLYCWCGNIYKLTNNRIFVRKLRIFRCFLSNRCVVSIHLMNIPFLFFTSEHIFDSQLRYSDIFYFMFSTFVQTKVRPKKSGTDEGQRHLFMYGEIEECIPCAYDLPSKFRRQLMGPMRFDRSRKRNTSKVSRRRHMLHPDTRVDTGAQSVPTAPFYVASSWRAMLHGPRVRAAAERAVR